MGIIGFRNNVSATGQASIQFKQDVHSSDTTVFTLSTFINEGQALLHKPQSIQLTGFLLIFVGLRKLKYQEEHHKDINTCTKNFL